MAGLRILSVFVVSSLCFLDARGVQEISFVQNNAIGTLKTILDDAVKDDIITEDKASNLLSECTKQGLTKKTPEEILDEALQVGWRNFVISNNDFHKLKLWGSKNYTDTSDPMETLSVSDIVAWLKVDVPSIESQLGQLNGDKLKAVEIVATVLQGDFDVEGIPEASAVRVTEAVIKSALENNDDAMTSLNKTLRRFVSTKVIPEMTVWTILRAAVKAGLDKKIDN